VEVSVAQIYGTVVGNVTATKRIELGRVAKVTGDIQTPALVIEQGAVFEGSCRMQQIKDEQAKGEARAAAGTAASSSASSPSAGASTSATTGSSAKTSDGAGASTGSTSGTGAGSPQTGAQKPVPAIT
jgi:hypothetical protein